jgi:TPR repeat protein
VTLVRYHLVYMDDLVLVTTRKRSVGETVGVSCLRNLKKRKQENDDRDPASDLLLSDTLDGKELETLFNGVQCCNQRSLEILTGYATIKSVPLASAALAVLYAVENSSIIQCDVDKSVSCGQLCAHFLQQESSAGCRIAQCFRGLFLLFGICGDKNLRQANRSLKSSADQGFSIAQCYLAFHLLEKRVGNYAEAATALLQLASDQGNAMAQFHLGLRLAKGSAKIPARIKQATRMYKRAADQGYALAIFQLGLCKYEGTAIVPVNNSDAVQLFKAAARLGCTDAQVKLGQCYYHGFGTKKDLDKAIRLFKLGANAGDSEAQRYLGYCCIRGIGIEKNVPLAVELLSASAESGDVDSMFQLGIHLYEGKDMPQDIQAAFEVWMRAAQKGHLKAQYYVGELYRMRTPADAIEAVFWFQRSSQKGYELATNALGNCYRDGFGVAKNMNEAVRLYRQAAKKGFDEAQASLAHCYAHGLGVAKNVEEAIKWYRAASTTVKSAKLFIEIMEVVAGTISNRW